MSRRRTAVVLLCVGVATVVGACSGSPSMLDHHGTEARHVAGIWWLMFGLAAAVYVVVAGLIFVAIRRGRKGATPSRLDDNGFVLVGGIIVPVLILAVIAVVTVTTTRDLRRPSAGERRIEVTGERWWWDVRYPSDDVRTANEVHVPVGEPIDLVLRSNDVIHSFWVPQLAGKVDVIPGQTNHLRFEASEPGVYRGACAEFCGIQHAHMDFLVIAQTPAEFERWLTRRTAVGTQPTTELAAAGERIFMRETCAGCHTVAGTEAVGEVGPDLTDFGARRWIGAMTVRNTPENLAAWIRDTQDVKPGNLMPPMELSDDEVDALVAYLEGLQ